MVSIKGDIFLLIKWNYFYYRFLLANPSPRIPSQRTSSRIGTFTLSANPIVCPSITSSPNCTVSLPITPCTCPLKYYIKPNNKIPKINIKYTNPNLFSVKIYKTKISKFKVCNPN